MKKPIINALVALASLISIGLGFYSLAHVFSTADGFGNFYLIGGFILIGVGGGFIINLIVNAKDYE